MYEHTPWTVLEWIAAVPGHIPEQAVMFENHSQGDAMFVANVRLATSRKAGMFISNSQCAEYHIRKKTECWLFANVRLPRPKTR